MKNKIVFISLCVLLCFSCSKENDAIYKITAKTVYGINLTSDFTSIIVSGNASQFKNISKGVYVTQSNNKEAVISDRFIDQENLQIDASSEKSSSVLMLKFTNEQNQELKLEIPKKEILETFILKYWVLLGSL